MSEMNCPTNYPQIERDLEPFPSINLFKMKEDAVKEFGTHNAVCHYSIITNKVILRGKISRMALFRGRSWLFPETGWPYKPFIFYVYIRRGIFDNFDLISSNK